MESIRQSEENELRGMVMTKYHSIISFSEAIGWDRKKASRIINRVQKPSAKDMEQMAKCLDVQDVYTFVHLFLPSLSTKWRVEDRLDPLSYAMK